MSAASDAFAPAARVAGFSIEREIGRGASGVVYLAVAADGVRVALKVLRREALDTPDAVTRFEREARALRSVRHRALVPLVAAGRLDDGRPYLATAWVAGETLRESMHARGRLAPSDAWPLIEGLAEALFAAHAAGVVHRDLKPENVVIDEHGAPHVLDFGIAKTPRETTDTRLTATGTPLGTPAYMSPEQWWNQSVDAATDQYALGVMAFEMLAGRLPFAEERYVAMMQAHLAADPPSLASVGVSVAPAIETWIARLLSKDPKARFASMRETLDAARIAFGAARPNESHRAAAIAIALTAPLALVALGYTGSHDPRYWIRIAGFGIFPVLAFWLLALLALPRARDGLAIGAVATSAIMGSLGTYTGWYVVLRALERYPLARHFEVFNDGMSEANANRFMGFGLAAGVLAALPAKHPLHPSRDGWVFAAACAAFAMLAVLLGAPGASFVAGAAALAAFTRGAAGPTRGDVVRNELLRVAAVVCAAASALARSEARAAILWAESPSRAARVAEILASSAEHTATLAVSAIVVAGLSVSALWRWRAAPKTAIRFRVRPVHVLAALVCTVFVASDLYLHTRIRDRRDRLWAAMAPQFALFAQLDPPAGPALPPPSLTLALQVTPEIVAIDGERVGLTAGLASEPGRTALAVDLAHRLAHRDTPGLSLIVDRRVHGAAVRSALEVAYGLGVRRVDVLFTRGDAPRWRGLGPAETTFALPRDFGALPTTLDPDHGFDLDDNAPWSELASGLAVSMNQNTARLHIGR